MLIKEKKEDIINTINKAQKLLKESKEILEKAEEPFVYPLIYTNSLKIMIGAIDLYYHCDLWKTANKAKD